jgi:thioesterase domain-containing protein/aryl carrier-like protein
MTPGRVGPRDALERSIRKIWSGILGHRDFGVHDNFFLLGGNSVGMLSIQEMIRDLCGCELELADLFSAPTIAGTAVLMRGSARTEPAPLVPLAPDGSGPPIFCVHPLGGSAAVYFPLALSLPDCPVYGIQALGLYTGTAPQRAMSDLTKTYLAAIRTVAPEGPYVLVGYSLGGMIAFALAHEILDSNGQAPLVVLIDTPPNIRFQPDDPYRAVGSYALNLDLDYERIVQAGPEQAVAAIYQEAHQAGIFASSFPLERLTAIFDTALANVAAVSEYQPRRYDGELLVIRADSGGAQDAAGSDWRRYAPTVTQHGIGLPHAMMLEEKAARRIAAILTAHLSARGS